MEIEVAKKIIDLANACNLTDDYQHEIILDESRSICANKARGIGFTSAISFQKMMKILIPEVWVAPQEENIIMSATELQADNIISYVDKYWSICKSQFSTQLKIKSGKVEASNKRWIMSLACDPDAVRTWHGDAVFDEFAFFKNGWDYDVFKAVSGVLTTGGQVHFVSTPNGERGKFFELCERADRAYKKYKLHYTSCKREQYRASVLKAKKELLDWEFEEEYCCSFAPKSKGALPSELIDACIHEYSFNDYLRTPTRKVGGIDFAKLVDETAFIYLEKLENAVRKVIFCDTMSGDYDVQEETIIQHSDLFELEQIYGDRTGSGSKVCEDLEKKLHNFKGVVFSSPFKDKLFNLLKHTLQKKGIVLPNHSKLIKQLKGLQRKVTASGVIQYAGKHDDLVWALCLALLASEEEEVAKLEEKLVKNETAMTMNSGMYANAQNRGRRI